MVTRESWSSSLCTSPSCLTRAGKPAKRGADCPQRWGGGLKVSEPKSHVGKRALTLPVPVTDELRPPPVPAIGSGRERDMGARS